MTEKNLQDILEVEPMLKYFQFAHLAIPLAAAARPFCALAESVIRDLPRTTWRTDCLHKLLDAKVLAVQCARDVEASR